MPITNLQPQQNQHSHCFENIQIAVVERRALCAKYSEGMTGIICENLRVISENQRETAHGG